MTPNELRTAPRTILSLLLGGALLGVTPAALAQETPVEAARRVEPVVLTGADLPAWSRLPAIGHANADPPNPPCEDEPPDCVARDAHNGTLEVPPDPRPGAPVEDIAAFRWNGSAFEEIPVQVDEVFPYFLQNAPSGFSFYSGTDKELTYEWDTEAWKMTAGQCLKAYPAEDDPATTGDDRMAMEDPVTTLDDDDEIVFMASDAGERADLDAPGPPGTADQRQEIAIADPLSGSVGYVYLFQRPGGSTFDQTNGYVHYERDANADEYVDRNSFREGEPENIGSSNTGYGPNRDGTVCGDDPDTPEVETIRQSDDRFPRDGLTVTTDSYRWHATGRWMVREMHVAKAGQPGGYGPDLVDRWKGRAFQQNPDSSISVVGFEDEQVNWEANSALLGELTGPVRAIRETWGADSGTNVTKTETFYRDAVTYRFHVRVHPIPPDGLYTSWDYNKDIAKTYYNAYNPDGVAIDGVNDEEMEQFTVDEVPLDGRPAYFDAADPTHSGVSALENWEQIAGAGDNGSLVYIWELTGASTATNIVAVPYYRDDKCFDDGTGDNPVPRPWPGEASTDPRVQDGYAAAAGKPVSELTCDDKQGAYASHGLHSFVTHDTDNAFLPETVDEIDIRQWQFAVPTAEPTNIGAAYGNTVLEPLLAVAAQQANSPGEPDPEPEPEDTTISVSAPPRSSRNGQSTPIAARLVENASGDGVAGQPVRFLVNGTLVGEPSTDGSGAASVSARLRDGDVIRVEFGGNETHRPSSAEATYSRRNGASG